MHPHSDLEHLIIRAYGLIKEYQLILQASENPKEKERAKREIIEEWRLVRGYLKDYYVLCKRNSLPISQDIAEIATLAQNPSTILNSGGRIVTYDIDDQYNPSPNSLSGQDSSPNNQQDKLPASQLTNNNPWKSGLFYLIVFITVFAAIVIARSFLGGYELISAVIVALLTVSIVGALQLRNDNRLSDESFVSLVIEVFRQFPLFRSSDKHGSHSDSE